MYLQTAERLGVTYLLLSGFGARSRYFFSRTEKQKVRLRRKHGVQNGIAEEGMAEEGMEGKKRT